MKISIALAVYNGTNYLADQLGSYLSQTRLPDELVAVDDCSTDETVKMLEQFAAEAPFPVVILSNQINSGPTATFDRAFSNCNGDIIFPSDHDDIWLPTKLERMSREFEESPGLGLLQANAEVVDEKLDPLGFLVFERSFPAEKREKARKSRLFEVLVERNVVGGATCAFRADYRKFFLPIPTQVGLLYDGWLGLIISAMAETKVLDEPLMRYRQHARQQVGTEGKNDPTHSLERGRMALEAEQTYKEKISFLDLLIETLTSIYRQESGNALLREAISIAQRERERATEARTHFGVRGNLNPARIKRIPAIATESLKGRYHRYSRGLRSIARDLIDP